MQVDEDHEPETGDLMIPEPVLAADLVGTLLQDWSVTDIQITVQNSMSEDEDAKAD